MPAIPVIGAVTAVVGAGAAVKTSIDAKSAQNKAAKQNQAIVDAETAKAKAEQDAIEAETKLKETAAKNLQSNALTAADVQTIVKQTVAQSQQSVSTNADRLTITQVPKDYSIYYVLGLLGLGALIFLKKGIYHGR